MTDGRHIAPAMLSLIVLLAASPAGAQRTTVEQPPVTPARDTARLPAVSVVGAAPGVLETIPGSATVVDSTLLRRLRPASVKEALRKVPGVHVQDEDAFGLNLNVGLRGLSARRSPRVLLLEDGAPIHLGPYSDPSAHYHPPVEAIERIEVLKGSGQILHGPQTVGGVINFVRGAPPLVPGGSLTLAGGSRDFASARLRAGGSWEGRGAAVDYVRKQGDGTRRVHRHEVNDLVLRGVVPLGGMQRLSLRGSVYDEASRYGESGATQTEFDADPYGNALPNDAFDLRRYAAQAVHDLTLGGATLRTQLYGAQLQRTAWRQGSTSNDRFGAPGYARAFGCPTDATGVDDCGNVGRPRTYAFAGIEPRLAVAHRLLGGRGALDAGVRAHREVMVRQERTGSTPAARTGPLVRDNRIATNALAAFVQDRVRLGRWSVTPGVRVEHVRSENANRLQGTSEHDAYTEVLPGVGVAVSGWRGITLFAGTHRGFAPPRPADVLNPTPGEGLVQVDAEVSWNYEVGARVHGAASAEVTLFRIDFDNQIVKGDLVGSGQRFVNAGRTVHQGVELAGSLDAGKLARWMRGGYADAAYQWLPAAHFASDRQSSLDRTTPVRGRRLPFAPRHALSIGVGYARASGVDLRLDADRVGVQFADDLNTTLPTPNGQRGLLPGYTVLNASASAPLPRRGATLFASVKNVGDHVYITDRQEGIMVGMPRLISAGITWNF